MTLRLNSESELVNNINSVLDSNYDSLTISNISSEISGTIPYSAEEIVNYTNDVEEESSGPSIPAQAPASGNSNELDLPDVISLGVDLDSNIFDEEERENIFEDIFDEFPERLKLDTPQKME